MTLNRTRQIVVAGLTIATLGLGSLALAQTPAQPDQQKPDGPRWGQRGQRGPGGPGGHGMRGHRGPGGPMAALRQLDLTDAQKQQVQAIVEQHKDEFKAAGEKLRAARKSEGDLILATPPDEQAIRAKASELAALQADMAVLRARVHAEVFAVLTPEQQEKAKTLRAERETRRAEFRQRMQERRQQRQQQRQQEKAPQAPPAAQ